MTKGVKGTAGLDATHFNRHRHRGSSAGEFFVSDGYGKPRGQIRFAGQFLFDWARKQRPASSTTPHGITLDTRACIRCGSRERPHPGVRQRRQVPRPWKDPDRPSLALHYAQDGFLYVVDGEIEPGASGSRRILRWICREVIEQFGATEVRRQITGSSRRCGAERDVYVGDVSLGMRVQKLSRSSGSGGRRTRDTILNRLNNQSRRLLRPADRSPGKPHCGEFGDASNLASLPASLPGHREARARCGR